MPETEVKERAAGCGVPTSNEVVAAFLTALAAQGACIDINIPDERGIESSHHWGAEGTAKIAALIERQQKEIAELKIQNARIPKLETAFLEAAFTNEEKDGLTKDLEEARATISLLIEKAEPFVKMIDDERIEAFDPKLIDEVQSLSEAVAKARDGIS